MTKLEQQALIQCETSKTSRENLQATEAHDMTGGAAQKLGLQEVEPRQQTLGIRLLRLCSIAICAVNTYVVLLPLLLCIYAAVLLLRYCAGLLRYCAGLSAIAGRQPLAPHDRIWLHESKAQPMVVNAVLVFSAPHLQLHRLRSLIQKRIISHPDLARFAMLLEYDQLAGFAWVPDPNFDVERHVVGVPADGAPHNEAELQSWMGRLFAEPLPRDRPLWTLLHVEDYKDGGSALVFRCHHAVGDGIAMSGVLLDSLLDPQPPPELSGLPPEPGRSEAPPPPPRPSPTGPRPSTPSSLPSSSPSSVPAVAGSRRGSRGRQLLNALGAALTMPHDLLHVLLREEDWNVLHGLRPLCGVKRIAWSPSLPLAAVKHVKDHFGSCDEGVDVSVNDVLLSAASAALSRYIERATEALTADDAVPSLPDSVRRQLRQASTAELTLGVPFNVRTAAEMARGAALENRFAVVFLPTLLVAPDRRARLAQIVRAMRQLKRSTVPRAMFVSMQAVTQMLPSALARLLVDLVADGASAIVTNNRGPGRAMGLDGRPLEYYVSWAPQRASIGICVTLFTYNDTMRCSVAADASCMPDPAELVCLFVEEFRGLCALAGWEGDLGG